VIVQPAGVDEHVWRLGFSLEYELRPSERVGLMAGALYQQMDGEDLEDVAAGFSTGATYAATSSLQLRASAAHRFRFPTLRQLYDRDGGNPDLRTESADLYELGAEQQIAGRASVGLTLFQNDAEDFIERPPGEDQFQNAENYRFRGVEIVGTLHPTEAWFVGIGYAFLDAEDRSVSGEERALQYRPRHRVTGEARWRSTGGFGAALNVQHVAGQVYQSRREPVTQGELPDFTLVGVRLEQRLSRVPVALYAGVNNLFDDAYEESYGFPRQGQTFYVGADLGR